MSKIYIAIDGDDIGRYIEYLILKNDLENLNVFSNMFKKQMIWLKQELINIFNASVIFEGGDSLLLSFQQDLFCIKKINYIKEKFSIRSNQTLSIGIGSTIREAYFALKFSKASGKNCIRKYKEFTNE